MVTTKKYYQENKGEILAYQKRYRQENPDKWREKNKRWQDANPDKAREYRDKYSRSPKGTHARLKGRAKHDNIVFDMDRDEFVSWWAEQELNCHYCGRSLDVSNGQKKLNGYSIDRKDNGKGYTLDNIVLCCNRCNMAKGSWFTEEQMLEIAHKYFNMGGD